MDGIAAGRDTRQLLLCAHENPTAPKQEGYIKPGSVGTKFQCHIVHKKQRSSFKKKLQDRLQNPSILHFTIVENIVKFFIIMDVRLELMDNGGNSTTVYTRPVNTVV